MTAPDRVVVRGARPEDRGFVFATCDRLAAFELPAQRLAGEIVAGEVRTLERFYAEPDGRSTLLVAELDARPAGFVFLEELVDYFTQARHGHIGMLAVAEGAEGHGVGRALMEAAERWARERGYTRLTLNVFASNTRARRLYERTGFVPDTVKYLKTL